MPVDSDKPVESGTQPEHAFRKAVLSGMGILFPPLFTILIFAWVISTTHRYVLEPVTSGVREAIVLAVDDTRSDLGPEQRKVDKESRTYYEDDEGRDYYPVGLESFVPAAVYDSVERNPGQPRPETAKAYYRRYVELTYLSPYITVPLFLAVFIVLLYLLGRFIAAGIGRFFWSRFEYIIHQVPLVRNVYSSVKQVSDFLFKEREIEYTRVVAVEYPRVGIWSLGFVTGESMLDIRSAANEAVLSVLIPTSPMPVTGFTVTVRKSEAVDLDITVEQAFQYIVSCGVVVPPQQIQQAQPSVPAAIADGTDSGQSAEPAARE